MWFLNLFFENNILFLDVWLVCEEKVLIIDWLNCWIVECVLLVYLLGEVWFMGMLFNVDEWVLVLCLLLGELLENGF